MPEYTTPESVIASHAVPDDAEQGASVFESGEPPLSPPEQPNIPSAPEPAPDPFSEFGGRDSVANAMQIARAFESDEGITAVAVEALRHLGYDPDAIFGQEPEPAPLDLPPGWENLADDDVVTVAQAFELANALAARHVEDAVSPLYEMQQDQRQMMADQVVSGTLAQLGVDSEDTPDVLFRAQNYLAEDDWDPQHISMAVARGHADFVAAEQRRAQRYLEGKRQTAATVPHGMGRSSGAASESQALPEPKDLKEAQAMARAFFAKLGRGE